MKNSNMPYLQTEFASILRLRTKNIEEFPEFFKEEFDKSRKNSEKNNINYYKINENEIKAKEYYSFHHKINKYAILNNSLKTNNSDNNNSAIWEKKFKNSLKKEGKELYLGEMYFNFNFFQAE